MKRLFALFNKKMAANKSTDSVTHDIDDLPLFSREAEAAQHIANKFVTELHGHEQEFSILYKKTFDAGKCNESQPMFSAETRDAQKLANQLMLRLHKHKTDISSLFRSLDGYHMEVVRGILFYRTAANVVSLYGNTPLLKDMHVPDRQCLQIVYGSDMIFSEKLFDISRAALQNPKAKQANMDTLQKAIEKFVVDDIKMILYVLYKTTKLSDKYGSIHDIPKTCCRGIAGYDCYNGDLMHAVNRAVKDQSSESKGNQSSKQKSKRRRSCKIGDSSLSKEEADHIRDKIHSKKSSNLYNPPSYEEVLRRFVIAESFRRKRSSDGMALPLVTDSVRWCLDDFTPDESNRHPSGSNKHPSCSNGAPSVGEQTVVETVMETTVAEVLDVADQDSRLRKQPGRTAKDGVNFTSESAKPASNGTTSTKKPKRKDPKNGGGDQKRPKTTPQLPKKSDVNSESESGTVDSDIILIHNLGSEEEDVSTMKQQSMKLPSVLFHEEFLSRFYHRKTLLQCICIDGRIIRHGFILPKMRVTIPYCKNSDGELFNHHDAIMHRSPIPGDIVSTKEAKSALGFFNLTDPWNDHDGKYGLNALFLRDSPILVPDYDAVTNRQISLAECGSAIATTIQGGPVSDPLRIYGVGGYPTVLAKPNGLVDNAAPSGLSTNNDANLVVVKSMEYDQSPQVSANKVLIDAVADGRIVSVWAPPLPSLQNNVIDTNNVDNDSSGLSEFLGFYRVQAYTYTSLSSAAYTYRVERLKRNSTEESHDCGCGKLTSSDLAKQRFLLCNHFEFNLHPVVHASCPNDHAECPLTVTSLLLPPSSDLADISQEIFYDPTIQTWDVLASKQSLCADVFFAGTRMTPLPPPLYVHESQQALLSCIPQPEPRRQLWWGLVGIMSTLSTGENESILSIFRRSSESIMCYCMHKNTILRSLIGDAIFYPDMLAAIYSSMVPENVLIGQTHNGTTKKYFEERLGGSRITKLSDLATEGCKNLVSRQLLMWDDLRPMKIIRHGGRAIHYQPVGPNDGRKIEHWNNIQPIADNDPSILQLCTELDGAAKAAVNDPGLDFIAFSNIMGNIMGHGEHPPPQVPHCDTDSSYHMQSVNTENGRTNVLTSFVPLSADGAVLLLWPLLTSHATDLNTSNEMKILIEFPNNIYTLNGEVVHAGQLSTVNGYVGSAKVTPSSLSYDKMANLRLQTIHVPRCLEKNCNVNETVLIKCDDPTEIFHEPSLKYLKFFALSGDVSTYQTPHEVVVFTGDNQRTRKQVMADV